jgi:hypothetical protein
MPFDTANQEGVTSEIKAAGMNISQAVLETPTPYINNDFGILTAFLKADDAPGSLNPFSPDFNSADTFTQSISLADAWLGQGAYRLSSCRWEITDNTPALYVGGNLTCFRKDSMADHKTFLIRTPAFAGLSDVYPAVDNCTLYSGFPSSMEDAYRVPGSTSWNFKEGCYVVGTFNDHLEDFETLDPFGTCILSAGLQNDAGFTSTMVVGGIPGDPLTLDGRLRYPNPWTKTHLNHSGAYCTGLAKEVVFVLSMKVDMEIIPNAQSVLVDFIKPGVPASPGLRQLYSAMSMQIPPAVVRADNDAGDFFKKMIGVAAPLVSKIFPPAAPFVAPISGLATRGVDALSQRRKAKKQNQQQKPKTKQITGAGTVNMTLTREEADRLISRRSRR